MSPAQGDRAILADVGAGRKLLQVLARFLHLPLSLPRVGHSNAVRDEHPHDSQQHQRAVKSRDAELRVEKLRKKAAAGAGSAKHAVHFVDSVDEVQAV